MGRPPVLTSTPPPGGTRKIFVFWRAPVSAMRKPGKLLNIPASSNSRQAAVTALVVLPRYMEQADVVESQARHVGIFDEGLSGFRKLLRVLIVVSDDGEDFAAGEVDGDPIRDFEAGDFALVLVLVAFEIEFAMALIDFAVTVVGPRRRRLDPLLVFLPPPGRHRGSAAWACRDRRRGRRR